MSRANFAVFEQSDLRST